MIHWLTRECSSTHCVCMCACLCECVECVTQRSEHRVKINQCDMSSLNRGDICLFKSLNMSLKMFVFISNGVLWMCICVYDCLWLCNLINVGCYDWKPQSVFTISFLIVTKVSAETNTISSAVCLDFALLILTFWNLTWFINIYISLLLTRTHYNMEHTVWRLGVKFFKTEILGLL